jgi:acetyltransferase-like isoleucine patch superfamily enzyme
MTQPGKRSTPFEDPLGLIPRGLIKLFSIWVSLTYPLASKCHKPSIHFSCDLPRSKARRIKLGNSVQIKKDAILDVLAPPEEDGQPVIVVDDRTSIDARCHISARNCIHIEQDVMIAQSALITDHGYAGEDRATPACGQGAREGGRIRIGQGSWIGRGAAILSTQGELELGRNCVVAANAVVTRSFPAYSVLVGNPAKVIRQFDPARGVWVMGSAQTAEPALAK